MERLTNTHWRNDDPWELCGLGSDCNRKCVQDAQACPVALKLRRLAEYEDAEEQGLLVRLPCKRGDAITATVLRPFNGHSSEIQGEVSDVQIVVRVRYGADRYINFLADDFGKTVFLTREEAEAALRKRKGGGEDA